MPAGTFTLYGHTPATAGPEGDTCVYTTLVVVFVTTRFRWLVPPNIDAEIVPLPPKQSALAPSAAF